MGNNGNFCCGLVAAALLTVLYYYVLFHTGWAQGLAIFSIVFFALHMLGHLLSALLASFTLFTTGCLAILSCCTPGGPLACLCVAIVGLTIAFLVAFPFFLSLWGLLISIDLLHAGVASCPAHGVDCGVLVFLFAVAMFMSALKSKKFEAAPATSPHPTVQQQPAAGESTPLNWDDQRVMVYSYIFNPRSAAGYRYPTAPPPYSEA